MFSVGQKVICVNCSPRKDGFCNPTDEKLVAVGTIYTIRDIVNCQAHGYAEEAAFLLEEIVNPVRVYVAPTGPVRTELYFFASRFRPLRTTNIDVFTKMREPVPAREAELVD